METQLLQPNSDPLLAQFTLDNIKARHFASSENMPSTKTIGAIPSNYDSRKTQVYVVPSSKSDTPALIVWSRPLTSRKRLSSSSCTLTPEELLGVSAAKRALGGISPWSDGREKFDLSFDEWAASLEAHDAPIVELAPSAGAGALDNATGAVDKLQRHPSSSAVIDQHQFGGVARRQSLQARRTPAAATVQQQRRGVQQSIATAVSVGVVGAGGPESVSSTAQIPLTGDITAASTEPSSVTVSRNRLQSVYSRYSEKQAYKRLLKVLRRHPYLDKDSIKYNKLLLLENSLNICHKFQASLRSTGSGSLQRPETLEDLAVEESHLVSAIREHVTEIPYLAALAPKSDRRAAKIEARVRRMEKQADSCHNCHAMLCAYCLTSAAASNGASSSDAKSAVETVSAVKK
ncbi:hypothetical protein BOX15_Mlig007574g1 [Macrostomum lignano]|uniref:Uncharacterized protein n=2 Tax=Macrostomum lignano TaxID=282301 RepID=A0A267EDL8_9PLAT|nr:hypothetical protein BOX15_Mlig007574g1 [Macrostomum lignano]